MTFTMVCLCTNKSTRCGAETAPNYNKGGGLKSPYPNKDIQPLAPTEPGIDDLVALLASSTSAQYMSKRTGKREMSRADWPSRDNVRGLWRNRRAARRRALISFNPF